MEKSTAQTSLHPIEFQIQKRKRSDLHHFRRRSLASSSAISEEETAAQILIMLSLDKSSVKPASVSRAESSVRSESAIRPASISHQCLTCGKQFPSHQALGGHKSMHLRTQLKRKRSEAEAPLAPAVNGVVPPVPVLEVFAVNKMHACKECGKMYPTGQALGGHMREHFKGVISREKKVKFEFDLNLPPEFQVYKRKACEKNNGGAGPA